MSNGIRFFPKTIWILLDVSNGDYPVKNYTWWFETKKEALKHLAEHKANSKYAQLIGPVRYDLIK